MNKDTKTVIVSRDLHDGEMYQVYSLNRYGGKDTLLFSILEDRLYKLFPKSILDKNLLNPYETCDELFINLYFNEEEDQWKYQSNY